MAARSAGNLDNRPLAKRLEALSAASVVRIVESAAAVFAGSNATWFECGGAVVAYMGPGSPMNHAVGLGMRDACSAEDVDRIERFYHDRGERPVAAVCENADPAALAFLRVRGWKFQGFENVLVRPFAVGDDFRQAREVEVFEALSSADRDTWALVAATGFTAPDEPSREQLEIAAAVAAEPQSRLFVASIDGEIAGAAELCLAGGVAWLAADTTLPRYRRRGVQQALQAARLRLGAKAGCDLAVSEAAPRGSSQRNMERLGFEVAYRRLDLVGPQV